MGVTEDASVPTLQTPAEWDTFGAAAVYTDRYGTERPPEAPYLEELPGARRTVAHRLVRGLLRGRPKGLAVPTLLRVNADALPADAHRQLREIGRDALFDRIEPLPEGCRFVAFVPFPATESILVASIQAISGYDRYRLAGPVRLLSSSGDVRHVHPTAIVSLLADEAVTSPEQGERIAEEVAESVANLAFARIASPIAGASSNASQTAASPTDVSSTDASPTDGSPTDASTTDGSPTDVSTTDRSPTDASTTDRSPDTVGTHSNAQDRLDGIDDRDGLDDRDVLAVRDVLDAGVTLPGADPASAIERLATEGHPLHPAAKIRRGMTPAESLLYAPEFTAEIDVHFVAVETSHALEVQRGETLTERLYDRFPDLAPAASRAIPDDRSLGEFVVIPVHPWQYHRVVPDRYAAQIADGLVVPISTYTTPATPLLNLRTVVPYANHSSADRQPTDPHPHLKLAVDVQLTNVVRTVSPQAVSNGPHVSTVLESIFERESFDRLGYLSEVAATCYYPPGGPHTDGEAYDDVRNLAGLARQNPYDHPMVPDDAIPITVGSLLATSPVTDRPIVCAVIDRFAESRGMSTESTAAEAFFTAYVDVVVPGQLQLMCTYGIALETHPQNTIVVVRDGEPVATIVRDLGGIRVLNDRLSAHGLCVEAYPDSDLEAESDRDLHQKLYYACFQNHLTELIVTLVDHTPLEEATCWEFLRRRCVETFDRIRATADIPVEWVDRDERALFESPTTHKALTAMRLQGKRHEYVTSQISNPLAESAGEE